MKLSKKIEELEKSAVKLTVTVDKDDVAENYKQIVLKYAKNAQVPGFRKGHVPVSILERKYGNALKADVMTDLIDKALNEIFSDENEKELRPLPYAQPAMDTLPEFDAAKDLTFSVTYDVFPRVKNIDVKGVTVKEPQVTITEKEVEEELKAVQDRNATVMDKKDDEKVQKDDIVTINYSETDDDGNVIESSKREGFVFTVGSGENIYKIDDDIIGMKKGETKDIVKKYKKDDDNKELAGKTKKISVTVTAIKIRNLPKLDDELAQDVNEKYKTLDDLKKDITKNLELAKNRRISEMKNNDLLSQLIEKNKFDIPSSMLDAELQSRWKMMAQQFQTTTEQLDKMISSAGQSKEGMLKEWTGDSEKMLKSRIIVESLLRDRNISITPEEIDEEYKRIAEESGATVDEIKKRYADPRAKEYLIDEAKEQKLYKQLYGEVKVVKGDKVAFADLFKR
ncbi:trigger factor [Treponema parvum]|uniref:Trigger factor n=1 Tax=Treponema parvum TaxID=138851 RepID=A0A975F4D7_9SPIR|nr:trigger factor [Treponema parvum]QTQ14196.1 trigger factor [Treponema parvum]